MSEAKKGLFELMYAAGKGVIEEINKPAVRRKLSRKLGSAYDDAEVRIGEATRAIQKHREENFDNYDINKILEQKAIIKKLQSLQEDIKEEYKQLFDKDMVIDRD